jgi:hypothetical protein
MESRAAKMDIDDLLKYVTKGAYFFVVVLTIYSDRPIDFYQPFMTLEFTSHDTAQLFLAIIYIHMILSHTISATVKLKLTESTQTNQKLHISFPVLDRVHVY